ncbi:MAG: TrbI/VirB10 family protein [Alphaproteobacteria bacterium]
MANTMRDKIKETLDTTPQAVRWLLMIAAFVVVLMLLVLLIGRPNKNAAPVVDTGYDITLTVTPNNADFSNTPVGTKRTQVFRINATHDAIVDAVSVENSVPGFSANTAGCTNQPVNKDIPCSVDVTYTPGMADATGNVTLLIEWHDKNDTRDTNLQTSKIVIPVSAVGAAKKTEVKPEPVPEPQPVPVDDDIVADNTDDDFSDYDDFDNPEPIIGGEKNIFADNVPAPTPAPRRRAPEKCSDFAMPGYDTSGVQIGWIKPKSGRYEFHPFSDTECNNPTGIYNPDTGIITSIDGRGRKIGTDADHRTTSASVVPNLRSKSTSVAARPAASDGYVPKGMNNLKKTMKPDNGGGMNFEPNTVNADALKGSAKEAESVYSSMPYDRTFILRQFKPIPATIVSEVRADPSVYDCDNEGNCKGGSGIPVRATVDRNVYSDNGRTVIIPTGTLLLGYLRGNLPGPYKSIGRMEIKWYQFIRPDGVEFNFKDENQDPYSADSQGRVGVPGYGSTDYIEQMVMPLLTAVIPAAVNMIAPIADTFVNQIDLDNNTVVQSGTVRSSELAKNEVISAWNKVAQKLMVDALDNTVPPFSIAAGTRITVYSPVDLIATCGDDDGPNAGKKCAFAKYSEEKRREWKDVKNKMKVDKNDPSWVGQVRAFNLDQYCVQDTKGVWTVDSNKALEISNAGYDYRTVLAYCQAQNYQAINQAKYEAYYDNKVNNGIQGVDSDGKAITLTQGTKEYNEQVLGLKYDDNNNIINPFNQPKSAPAADTVGTLLCEDGTAPDANGCCTGETYTEMGPDSEYPFACCPAGSGDCFPPFEVN